MTINDWINEIDVKINYSLLDNTEWIKIHIDDLIELNECIKEFIKNGNSD
jgi:hypothetical protein